MSNPLILTEDDERLRSEIREHLAGLGLEISEGSKDKDAIRRSHRVQRLDVQRSVLRRLGVDPSTAQSWFAKGADVEPDLIEPYLIPVGPRTNDAQRFLAATLLWSVPVSQGYGRRLRFLVCDRQNGKLIGLFALGDPVFNLGARDAWVGWTSDDRKDRLVSVMDAFVVGAVPPYSQILGGKLVASLIASREVRGIFDGRYGDHQGTIRPGRRTAALSLVTVTSALGRSSIYNRLRLRDASGAIAVELIRVGETRGYGHFQLTDSQLMGLRRILEANDHPYSKGNRYGNGPNWRMRVARVGLTMLGLDSTLRHGIAREVFAMPLATNARAYLRGQDPTPGFRDLTAESLANMAMERWVRPRAARDETFRSFDPASLAHHFDRPGDGVDLASWSLIPEEQSTTSGEPS